MGLVGGDQDCWTSARTKKVLHGSTLPREGYASSTAASRVRFSNTLKDGGNGVV